MSEKKEISLEELSNNVKKTEDPDNWEESTKPMIAIRRIPDIKGCVVHYCDWAQEPEIHLACGKWTIPAWGKASKTHPASGLSLPDGIFMEVGGGLYTFDKEQQINCEKCLKYTQLPPIRG